MNKNMRLFIYALFPFLLCLGEVHADGYNATKNFFNNLKKARYDPQQFLVTYGSNLNVATVIPTLVKGIYSVQIRNNGNPIFYINEDGTFYGGSDGVNVLPTDGTTIRKMTDAELSELRKEIIDNLRYDKLLKSTYGNGGGRRLLMLSAIDCPVCKDYENALQKAEKILQGQGKSLNTTFYVIPSSLQSLEPSGWNIWKNVSSIWCNDKQAPIWQNYWSQKALPNTDIVHCDFSPNEASRAFSSITAILVGSGFTNKGYVPLILKEDGSIFNDRSATPADYSELGLPQVTKVKPHWIVPGADDINFASKPIGKPELNTNAPPKTIRVDNLLKGIFK